MAEAYCFGCILAIGLFPSMWQARGDSRFGIDSGVHCRIGPGHTYGCVPYQRGTYPYCYAHADTSPYAGCGSFCSGDYSRSAVHTCIYADTSLNTNTDTRSVPYTNA